MRPTLLLVLLFSAAGCASDFTPTFDGGAAAGHDANREAGAVRCWNDSRTLACDTTREICVDDYAHVAGGNHCAAIPSACAGALTCDCLTANIHCGITTTCSMTGGRSGQPMLTCQPD